MPATAVRERVQTLEKGALYFFYRPKIGDEHPKSIADVQRFYLVLKPDGAKRWRRAVVGHKRLPRPSKAGHRRFWGFVDMVAEDPKDIVDDLRGNVHATKTRGTEHQPSARPAGEGVYRLLRHADGALHTHLVYALAKPSQEGQAQESLDIEPEASYIISVRNPGTQSKARAGLNPDEEAHFPEELREKFGRHTFIDADPPRLLDFEGAEFVLISASADVKGELGMTLHPESEKGAYAEMMRVLREEGFQGKMEPLYEGKWE